MDLWMVPSRRRGCPPSQFLTPGKLCKSSINEKLPLHVVQIILSKLSISQFPICSRVCKDWNALLPGLSSNSFLVFSEFYRPSCSCFALHSAEYTVTPTQRINFSGAFCFGPQFFDVSVVGSCNGLLCITEPVPDCNNCALIINPMTNENFRLPGSKDWSEVSAADAFFYHLSTFYCYGLGFIPKTKQYKIARVAQPNHGGFCSLYTFTFGTSTEWTHVSRVPFSVDTHGVYFDGALYWVGMNNERDNVIYRLNLEDDKFEAVFWKRERKMSIMTFNGGLYATTDASCGGEDKFEVWKMQRDSWIREFVVTIPPAFDIKWSRRLQLVQACEDGEILCLVHRFYFVLYSPKTGAMRTVNQAGSCMCRNNRNILTVYHTGGLRFESLEEIFAGNHD